MQNALLCEDSQVSYLLLRRLKAGDVGVVAFLHVLVLALKKRILNGESIYSLSRAPSR